MALHLNGDKDQNVVFGSSFFSNPVFERRRGEKGEKRLCKTREIPISGKRAKIVISVKNPIFIPWISIDETDFTAGIVSRNLTSTSNFIKFRDSRNLHFFRGIAFRV